MSFHCLFKYKFHLIHLQLYWLSQIQIHNTSNTFAQLKINIRFNETICINSFCQQWLILFSWHQRLLTLTNVIPALHFTRCGFWWVKRLNAHYMGKHRHKSLRCTMHAETNVTMRSRWKQSQLCRIILI